jgi:hypothetical protein
MKNTHNLVILSLKRGEYLTDIIRGVNGEDNMFFADEDRITEALEFAACYTEAELRSLAESFGPDLEVQPKPRYYAIMAEDLNGPAYGVGTDEDDARINAQDAGFGGSGKLVEITADSYAKIMQGNPQAVEVVAQ